MAQPGANPRHHSQSRFFQIPDEEPERWQQLPLAMLLARRDWQNQLSARIDQEKTTITALNTPLMPAKKPPSPYSAMP
ncbi:hypothetical protein [Leptodesmis sp.]|uniref:hypothetical protein n=1 Tax=Leptodesmis sp. TaxID=3100501 RepID=UPI0040534CBA